MNEEMSWCTATSTPADRVKCRLYPKLSFFFDGTGNNLHLELRKSPAEQALSNIAKLFQSAIDDKDGKQTLRRYFPGVGTPYRYPYGNLSPNEDKGGAIGLGFGTGGELRLEAALTEFRRILEIEFGSGAIGHMQWVSLSVFGFSRGATLARAFVRRLIAEQCERTADGLRWKGPFDKTVRLRIIFMGLFDTVASVGGPGLHLGWGEELAIPAEVERCVHLVSGHEVRQAFPLDSVRVGKSHPSNCEEVVYPGVHSDVGGGYFNGYQGRSNFLARIPLREMYGEALKAGVMLRGYSDLPEKTQDEFALTPDAPVIIAYQAYMAALAPTGGSLEEQIQAHRCLKFQWRGAITRAQVDHRVLGALYRQIDPALCNAVVADNPHTTCSPRSWKYELSTNLDKQARQLLGEHRRLVRQIPFIRDPMEQQGDARISRARKDYENLIIAAWDSTALLADGVELLLADHAHDSVAHFTEWPCALYDQRGIFCDKTRYLAKKDSRAMIATA